MPTIPALQRLTHGDCDFQDGLGDTVRLSQKIYEKLKNYVEDMTQWQNSCMHKVLLQFPTLGKKTHKTKQKHVWGSEVIQQGRHLFITRQAILEEGSSVGKMSLYQTGPWASVFLMD